jgi:curved DNA-binding protein CbpA
MEKFYKILEIHTNATAHEVRQAYRDLVKVWHPDRFMYDVKLQKKAEEKLKEINEAYQKINGFLNNSNKRQQAQQYRQNENQDKTASQPPPKQPHTTWICPECLRANYKFNLRCDCGFKADETEIRTYRANQTSAELYDDIEFNRIMKYSARAEYLVCYLLKKFPNSQEADILRKNPSGVTQPKQTKLDKLLHFKKYWGWYVFLILWIFVMVNAALNPETSRKQASVENRPSIKAPQPLFAQPVQPLPANGTINKYYSNEAVAPLRIVTRESSHHYFVKIVDWYSGNLVLTVFINSGQSISIDLPLGSYKLKYATGRQWYGTTFLFGPETSYNIADKKFDFEIRGDHVSGYTVELVLQRHGNLRTNKILAEQF